MVKIGHPSMSATFDLWSTLGIFEEYFYDDWRKGEEIQRIVITQRLYQTSPSSTQARFSKT